eukprot:s3695_g5.t1
MTYGAIARMPALWSDEAWMTLAVVRTQELQAVQAGYPKSFVHFLKWLKEEIALGFTLVLNEEPILCHIAKISLVADADGIRVLTGCKGSSGLKCCYLCQNVLTGHTDVLNHVHISSGDINLCAFHTDDSIAMIRNHLQSLLRRKEREEAEKLLGWHLHLLSASILMQENLKDWMNLNSLRYDAMHCFLAKGIVPLKNWVFGILPF